jgi:hypothetical protein
MGLRDYLADFAGQVLANAQGGGQPVPNSGSQQPTSYPLDTFAQVVLQSSPPILNQNYGFETGIAPWTGQDGATLSQSNVWSYQGTYSALFTGNGATANPEMASENSIPVSGSTTYTFSGECYSPQGWATTLALVNWYTSNGTYISTSVGSTVAVAAGVTAGTLVSVTATSPSNAAFAQCYIQMTGTPATTVQMFVDLAQMNAGSTPTNGLGSGIASIGPQAVRQYWQVSSISVGTGEAPTAIANDAQCSVYLGTTPSVSSGQLIGTTRTGSSGDSLSGGAQPIKPGYLLIAQWLNGDPGATATMHILGTYSNGLT